MKEKNEKRMENNNPNAEKLCEMLWWQIFVVVNQSIEEYE